LNFEITDNLHTYFAIRKSLINFLEQDLGTGDITSNYIIEPNTFASAELICKSEEPATVAGLEEAGILFEICGCTLQTFKRDGERVDKGCVVMKVIGLARSILKAERTALNLIMRMSGIATETRKVIELVRKVNKSTRIACTRKTASGLSYFDKKAVELGGGWSHRMRLDDMVLIKDNHLVLNPSIEDSARLATEKTRGGLLLECEVKNLAELCCAIRVDIDIIMLDNFSLEQAKAAMSTLMNLAHPKKIMIEMSGGIGLQNILSYAQLNPDIISLGYITHSPKAIDFSLKIINDGGTNLYKGLSC
jgi:nicotinate-nucleotide pyrophosphorylase (carboxylating)